MKMLQVVMNGVGSPDVLALAEAEIPVPRAHEVVIRVHAAGVNRPDIAQREGDILHHRAHRRSWDLKYRAPSLPSEPDRIIRWATRFVLLFREVDTRSIVSCRTSSVFLFRLG